MNEPSNKLTYHQVESLIKDIIQKKRMAETNREFNGVEKYSYYSGQISMAELMIQEIKYINGFGNVTFPCEKKTGAL